MRTAALVVAFALAPSVWAQSFTATEMMKLKRLADPDVSPDGKWVAFAQTEIDASFQRNADIWLVPVAGGAPRRMTSHPKSDSRPRFSPDGSVLAFLSNRDGASQVYAMDLLGGEARRVTLLPNGVDSFSWLNNHTLLAVSDVFADCKDDACQKRRLEESEKGPRVYDKLFVRHWDTWEDGRRTHVFAASLAGDAPLDLTPGDRDALPFNLGGPDDYASSPDGREVCFARNDDAMIAASTNADLFVIGSGGGEARKISTSPGYDGAPRYSPDGSKIAYRSQARGGYESDRWRLMVYDRKSGATIEVAPSFDRHVESFGWSPDSKTLFLTAGDQGTEPLYSVPAAGGTPRKIADGTFSDARVAGRQIVVTQTSFTYPTEISRVSADGTGLTRITHVNDAFLAGFRLRRGESVRYTGAAGKSVQAWIVKPADFDPAKKYPLLVVVHGGPQVALSDAWSFRWNAQVFANAGYVVLLPNFRGSPGFGQEFVEDVSGDWGGRAYEDVMKGTDYAEALPHVDKGRTVAAGASYGGFMINWIAGHTDRFKALVSHDGVFDQFAMYGSTEELWFTEWEMKGTAWDNPQMYEKWSPSRFAGNFKTPTLVIHGELDYRVPLEQGLGMFTALQRKGVPSKLVVFPDENHWVLKPANSVRWYKEVLSWLDRWAKS